MAKQNKKVVARKVKTAPKPKKHIQKKAKVAKN